MAKYLIQRPHGIMYHHFHNDAHPVGQGSISAEDFEKTLQFIGIENIMSAGEWMQLYKKGSIPKSKVCITFDDSLKCQFDVAKPILDRYNIKAFFFVYSSVLKGQIEYLEVFRYFRNKYFKDFDEYFEVFMKKVESSPYKDEVKTALASFDPAEYLKTFLFYTVNDRIFRYLRDHILKADRYNEITLAIMKDYNIQVQDLVHQLWMSAEEVKLLHREGHVIGLHSDTHPMTMGMFEPAQQQREYSANKSFLESLLQAPVTSMSHPCNSYSTETFNVLKDLSIQIGFRANMTEGHDSEFEIPREDHINIINMMKDSRL